MSAAAQIATQASRRSSGFSTHSVLFMGSQNSYPSRYLPGQESASMRPAVSQLDLRLLRYFVTVAETEHVGRAAIRLGLSQSPLSRQLRQLETRLGLSLFVRESRRIRLSDAGERLLPEAMKLLKDATRLVRWAERLSRG